MNELTKVILGHYRDLKTDVLFARCRRVICVERYGEPKAKCQDCKGVDSGYWTWHWSGYFFHVECAPNEEQINKEAKTFMEKLAK